MILGIETSCDETAAALVTDDGEIRSNVVSSQAELHARYGGVVPEVASRRHLELVSPVVQEALGKRVQVSTTSSPLRSPRDLDLLGALLVGLSAAKALAWARGLPLVPVDHLHGHVASLYLGREPVEPPFLCLLVSRWSHAAARSARPLGLSRARHIGRRCCRRGVRQGCAPARPRLPGWRRDRPAGARREPGSVLVPVARLEGFDFSFSGLKTALLYRVRDLGEEAESRKADLAASYQRAIVQALVEQTARAAEQRASRRRCGRQGRPTPAPRSTSRARAPLELCTDNAAMIASAGRYGRSLAYPRYLDLDAYASRA